MTILKTTLNNLNWNRKKAKNGIFTCINVIIKSLCLFKHYDATNFWSDVYAKLNMLHIPNCMFTGTRRLIPYLTLIKSVFPFHSFPTIPIYTTLDEINVSFLFGPNHRTTILTQQLELLPKYRQHLHSKFGEHSSAKLFIAVTYIRRYLRKKRLTCPVTSQPPPRIATMD